MGKRARAKRHVLKMNAKRALKATRRAYYESLRAAGKNKKSKRFVKKSRGSNQAVVPLKILIVVPVESHGVLVLAGKRVHGGPKCSNVGCKRCSNLWKTIAERLK